MSRTNYLLDTNVVLTDLIEMLNTREDFNIIISGVVLSELDNQKGRDGLLGYQARRAVRKLFEIRQYGDLNKWVKLENNVNIMIEDNFDKDLNLNYEKNDDEIIGCLSYCNHAHGKTILMSNDLCMCLKAEKFGFKTEQTTNKKDYDFYTGHIEIMTDDYKVNMFYDNKEIDWKEVMEEEPPKNMCVTLTSIENPKKQALSVYRKGRLTKLRYGHSDVFGGTKGKNRQQKYLLELLMDDDIKIVAVNSDAGTGKSYLGTIVGLEKTLEKNIYDKILYIKPLVAMGGQDIGYLPSDKNDKLLGGYAGTLNNILDNVFAKKRHEDEDDDNMSHAEYLMEKGLLQVEAPTFMRGMSYLNTYIIIDEASNVSASDIKNMCTRCGEGSKIILLGDGKQLDNSKVTVFDNGLQHVIESLKDEELFGTIKLDKSVRSSVAQLCVDKL